MELLDLSLKNIGPFDEAKLEFARADAGGVTFITGENGTGKTVVIDAIRALCGHPLAGDLPRALHRPDETFSMTLGLDASGRRRTSTSTQAHRKGASYHEGVTVYSLFQQNGSVADFWRSDLASDSFKLNALTHPDHSKYLQFALEGKHRNQDLAALIVYFDYLRDSREAVERSHGELLYSAVARIIESALIDGTLSHVERSRLSPIIAQYGRKVGLDKLSSGSLYMAQRMVTLLGRMFSCVVNGHTLHNDPLKVSGILLIDEAENHLHPKWQKRLIPSIRKLFPNLQLVVATHSPFIIGSVPRAKVYVCRAEPKRAVTVDVSNGYHNLPVEEILASAAFAETVPFGETITKLLEQRREAITNDDAETQARVEAELRKTNADYFGYLELDVLLDKWASGN